MKKGMVDAILCFCFLIGAVIGCGIEKESYLALSAATEISEMVRASITELKCLCTSVITEKASCGTITNYED